MRDATELEVNSINDYVNRISVDTGVNFHNLRGERGMIKLTAYYTDGTTSTYTCVKVTYDARVIFAQTEDGKRICIPYANVYAVVEEESE